MFLSVSWDVERGVRVSQHRATPRWSLTPDLLTRP